MAHFINSEHSINFAEDGQDPRSRASASDLIVTAFDSQGLFYMPWSEIKRKYGAQAVKAVVKAGLDLSKLEKESRRLFNPRYS